MTMTILIIMMFVILLYLTFIRAVSSARALFKGTYNQAADESWTPTVSVMMSCFNEGEAVYETIKSIYANDYPTDKIQVVAFDDASKDDSWEWLQKAERDFPGTIIDRNVTNLGKPPTMLRIAERVTGDVLIGTDTDTVFHPRTIREMTSTLKDQTIGGVGGVVGIKNANDTLLTQVQVILYFFSFYFIKQGENITRTVQCLAGPIVAYRREIYFNILLPLIKQRNFLGVKICYGEDRFITQQLLAHGYKTVVNHRARCWVGTPTKWPNYLNQQLRWRRGGIESWFQCLFNLPERIEKAGVMATLNCIIPFIMHFAPLVMFLWVAENGLILSFMVRYMLQFVMCFSVLGWIINWLLGLYDPRQKIDNPLLATAMFAVWFPLNILFLTPWALLTLDEGGWVTRQDGMKGNV